MKFKVVIAEDEPAILRGICAVIAQLKDEFEIIGTSYNGKEAFELIESHHPDIVITDIRMPIMNGLSMIKKAKTLNLKTKFIILTGYAEFEYARAAITLDVKDYLLKPVDPDQLEEIMTAIKNEFLEQKKIEQFTYIKNQFYKNSKLEPISNPLMNYYTYFLFCYFGPITNNIYGEFHEASELTEKQSLDFIEKISKNFSFFLYVFRGNYFNETVYAIVYPKDKTINIKQIIGAIKKYTFSSSLYTNYILSEQVTNGLKIKQTIQNCYLYTLFHIPFGRNEILYCDSKQTSDHIIQTTKQIQEVCKKIHSSLSEDSIKEIISSIIDIWKNLQITQFQLQADLRYILSFSTQQSSGFQGIFPDIDEIIASSYSFQELEDSLILEMKKIFLLEENLVKKHNAKSLIEDVKNFLDKNFTQTITYKTFYDIFGYNEKYITTLFKEEYGISPNKYIIELRLKLAKQLMKNNPDLLLKDIAEMVGYSDSLYFSRVFKNSEGISPSTFLKNLT